MSRTQTLAAVVEERLLIPAYCSPWTLAPIVAHRGMALPLQLTGRLRRRRVKLGDNSLDLVEVGREKLLRPLVTRIFGEQPQPADQTRRVLWSPASLAAESGADLVLAEVHRWMAPRFHRAGWLIIPRSVRWAGELASIPPAECSHGLRDNLRKVRQQGFAVEQASSAEDWKEFYTTMVEPQAVARHGPSAWIPSPHLMSRFARAGILHFITRGGERVAGICVVPRGDTLWLAVSGIRHGDRHLLQQGAGFATLSLVIAWARSQGYRKLDAGRTGPFVNDGLQQFKRKWGLLPLPDPMAHVAAVWVNSPAVREAFAREPVLVEYGSSLRIYAGE